MAGNGLPRYPNYRATFGTSLAVVTSLMASISTAIVVVLSASTAAQAALGFLRWTPDQIGTATGSLAIVFFVAATLGSVYAQAANYEELPAWVIVRLLKGRTDKEARKSEWKHGIDTAYMVTRACWIYGVSLLLVTLGTLAFGKVPIALPVLAAVAAAAAMLNLLDPDFRPVGLIASSVLVCAGSVLIIVAAAWALWP